MNIKKTKDGGKMIVALSGRLDTTTAPDLQESLTEDIGDVTELIFDMKELEYISSAGLRVLLWSQKTMNKQGTMELCGVQDPVMDVFEVTGFSDILTII